VNASGLGNIKRLKCGEKGDRHFSVSRDQKRETTKRKMKKRRGPGGHDMPLTKTAEEGATTTSKEPP